MQTPPKWLLGAVLSCLIVVASIGIVLLQRQGDPGLRTVFHAYPSKPFDLKKRPEKERSLYDYARILEDMGEATQKSLETMKTSYRLEGLIISMPDLHGAEDIQHLAAQLFSNWGVGKDYDGRGFLLLFIKDPPLVKLEVGYELEDVFTDAFTGYIEDYQLRPYFLSGEVGTGLVAVMEELEERAQLKRQGEYTMDSVAQLDRSLLSGGAGAKRDLLEFYAEKKPGPRAGKTYPAGRTPDEAWQTLISVWRDKVKDPNLGVYTEAAKLAYRDYQHASTSRHEKQYRTYRQKPYTVLRTGKYAVISFGNQDGWDNAPFLFFQSAEGWKLDMASMRRLVTMGRSPKWGVQRTPNPYAPLLNRFPHWMRKDLPLEEKEIYRPEKDQDIGEKIRLLEEQYRQNPDAFDVALDLGRLYVMVGMRPGRVFRALNKAKTLNRESPTPYKYLAMYHVTSNFQYRSAIQELGEYIRRAPGDASVYAFLGYLYMQERDYEQAIVNFQKAVADGAHRSYAYAKLSRIYGHMFKNTNRREYRKLALEMFGKAEAVQPADAQRIHWLQSWLGSAGILEPQPETAAPKSQSPPARS